jgi:hypothetical protein
MCRECGTTRPPVSDEQLLDFDVKALPYGDRIDVHQLLAQHPAVYRSHLHQAAWLFAYADRLEAHSEDFLEEDGGAGRIFTLRDIATHLRQGDFLPDGPLLCSP